ncbi:MAG: hypothetical protein JXQ81_05050 [Desulfuromonadales bacterium]|nr:hypothetical protein [Desulfuromonadales bacterium]MBN2791857.1 hypothetical protein [Desulfuromonadales bacterium]
MKRLLLLFFIFTPFCVSAASTVSCHCFQDRTFNHRDSAAADPYFLATTQNSFISLLYGVDKAALVKAKMSGTNGTHLWIVQDVAAHSGQSTSAVADIYSVNHSWPEVFKTLGLGSEQVGELYLQLGNHPEQLADHIVDSQLVRQFAVTPADLQRWRHLGMSRKELILAILLEGDPAELYQRVNSRAQTWGELLDRQGMVDGHAISRQLKARMQHPRS